MGACYTWLDIDFFCSFNRRKKNPKLKFWLTGTLI